MGDAGPLVLTVGNRHSSPDVTMAIRSARQRVLIVDDDARVRQRLTRTLTGAGCEVVGALDPGILDLAIVDLNGKTHR